MKLELKETALPHNDSFESRRLLNQILSFILFAHQLKKYK